MLAALTEMRFRAAVFVVLCLSASAVFAQCFPPIPPTIVFSPTSGVAVGRTYAIDWSDTTAGDGSYIVERSTSPRFDVALQQQRTGGLAASFVSNTEGIYYHRLRAVPACDATKESSNSAASAVTIVTGPPDVVITVHPSATILGIGDSLSDARAAMTIENVSRVPVTVALTTAALSPSPAFFTVNDPAGGNVAQLPLTPGVPKAIEIRFNGVSTSAGGTFQGLVAINGVSAPLPVTPYAYVNLKIGSSMDFIHPSFRVGGLASEFASFPGWSAMVPDTTRPPLRIEIVNPGNTPLEIGGEIAPEGWLIPKAGWNANPIPPNSSLQVDLFTDRSRANANSPLPRYTYFTVRSKAGFTARILVQDNDVQSQAVLALPPVSPVTQSFVLVNVADFDVSPTGDGSLVLRTRARISNVSSAAVRADVFFISAVGAFPLTQVNRTSIVIPPNDVVVFSDVLRQLFATSTARRTGSLEIRTDAQDAHFLTVSAVTYVQQPRGELASLLPVVLRGEGARQGDTYSVPAIISTGFFGGLLSFVETSRVTSSHPVLTAILFDKNGAKVGHSGTVTVDGGQWVSVSFQTMFGIVSPVPAGSRVEFTVLGNGTVTGVMFADNTVYISGPVTPRFFGKVTPLAFAVPKTYAVLGATNEQTTTGGYTTFLGMSAPTSAAADLTFSYLSAGQLSKVAAHVTVPAGMTIEFANIYDQLFGIPLTTTSRGTILIDTTSTVSLYGRIMLTPRVGTLLSVVGNLPILSTASEALTSGVVGYQRPIYFDGLEQTTDPTRGSRWSVSLTELYNAPATVTVRLYEAGNRSSPIAETEISLAGHEQKILDPVFTALGLDQADRRKDRTNVQVVVVPKFGNGVVAAVAIGNDNVTGVSTRFVLGPNGGVPATGVSKVAEVPPPTIPPRHRSVHQ